jgi:hypothetical protein
MISGDGQASRHQMCAGHIPNAVRSIGARRIRSAYATDHRSNEQAKCDRACARRNRLLKCNAALCTCAPPFQSPHPTTEALKLQALN